jgi:hypothetical protein
MPQHDYDLANQSGAAFRSDLNDALDAIVTQNSGATEPSTMFARMFWADTTAGLLKIRNASNTDWVTVGTMASANLGLLPLAGGTMTGALNLAMGTGAGTAVAIGKAHVNTTAVGNVGTGTDDLMSYTLPANSLSANGKGVRVTAWGTTANNANAKAIAIVVGSTSVNFTMTASAAKRWRIVGTIIKTGANAQDVQMIMEEHSTGGTTAASLSLASNTLTAVQTDTADIIIKSTGIATNDNDIVQEGMLVEFF